MNLTAHGSTFARAMCDTLAQLALEMVCKQLAVAVSGHSPAQHGVLYLTTSSPRLRHVALHGTFLPPMSGDVGCLKFHNPPTDAALPPHVSGEIIRGISGLPDAALGHAHLHVCTLGTQRLRSRAALPA